MELIIIEDQTLYATSYAVAKQTGVTHRSVMQLIKDKKEVIEKHFNHVRFENAVGNRPQGGGTPEQFCKLTEGQVYFILTLTRNTKKSEEVKALFVQAFMDAKEQIRALQQPTRQPASIQGLPWDNTNPLSFFNSIATSQPKKTR